MIKRLTSLRGIFILFIFFHHCDLYPGGGSMAVAFFFVLGGFCMTLGYKDQVMRSDFSYKKYIIHRCIKFYPLHWLCLLAALPLSGWPFTLKKMCYFVTNAALLQTILPIQPLYFSYNGVSWYLANTLFFTVLFPVLIKWILKSSTQRKVCTGILFVVLYVILLILLPRDYYHAILYICPFVRLTDFVFGIFLSLGYLKLMEKSQQLWLLKKGIFSMLLIVVTIILLVVESCFLGKGIRLIAPLYWPLVAFLILTASLSDRIMGGVCIWGNLLENKFLQRFGELSFVFFLTHQLVLRYIQRLFITLQINNSIVFASTTLVLAVLVSILVKHRFLIPVTQWLTKKEQPFMIARS